MNTTPSALAEIQSAGSSGYALRMQSESHRTRVAAVGRLFAEACRGDRYAQLEFHDLMGGRRAVRESMSTSDFPILFGDVLNRELARRYQVRQPIWRQFAARKLQRDFRPSKIIEFFGGGGRLDAVPELKEYPARAFDESEFETVLAKYGNRLMWSWEMQVNDDLGAFQTAPDALSRGAVATEDYLATSVLVDASGPKSWLGTPGTADLSRAALEAGLQAVMDASDEDGNPIEIGTPILMVPRALALTAQNIVNTTEFETQAGADGNGQVRSRVTGNGLSATPRIVVNDWLTRIDESANRATTWYLLPDPSGPRPAVYETFLTGYESPDLRVKADAGMRLGGGNIDPSEGSFERDAVEYRIRHVVGGNQGFADAVYVSNGSA